MRGVGDRVGRVHRPMEFLLAFFFFGRRCLRPYIMSLLLRPAGRPERREYDENCLRLRAESKAEEKKSMTPPSILLQL